MAQARIYPLSAGKFVRCDHDREQTLRGLEQCPPGPRHGRCRHLSLGAPLDHIRIQRRKLPALDRQGLTDGPTATIIDDNHSGGPAMTG